MKTHLLMKTKQKKTNKFQNFLHLSDSNSDCKDSNKKNETHILLITTQ